MEQSQTAELKVILQRITYTKADLRTVARTPKRARYIAAVAESVLRHLLNIHLRNGGNEETFDWKKHETEFIGSSYEDQVKILLSCSRQKL